MASPGRSKNSSGDVFFGFTLPPDGNNARVRPAFHDIAMHLTVDLRSVAVLALCERRVAHAALLELIVAHIADAIDLYSNCYIIYANLSHHLDQPQLLLQST